MEKLTFQRNPIIVALALFQILFSTTTTTTTISIHTHRIYQSDLPIVRQREKLIASCGKHRNCRLSRALASVSCLAQVHVVVAIKFDLFHLQTEQPCYCQLYHFN